MSIEQETRRNGGRGRRGERERERLRGFGGLSTMEGEGGGEGGRRKGGKRRKRNHYPAVFVPRPGIDADSFEINNK